MEHPEALPEDHRPEADDELPQRVTDYIAGMTDRFAIRTWEQISGELSAFSLGERR
jgi:dGTPase